MTAIGKIIARPDTSTMLERRWHEGLNTADDSTVIATSVDSWQFCEHMPPHEVLVGLNIPRADVTADISLAAARALLEALPAAIEAAERATAYQP